MLTIHLTTEQKVLVTLHPSMPVDGLPEWMIVEGESTVEASDNGMSAELVSADVPGETTYMVTVDRDMNWTVDEVSELIKVIVRAPQLPPPPVTQPAVAQASQTLTARQRSDLRRRR